MEWWHALETVCLLTVVGAVIGGLTNDVAIRMLFKPYRPLKIGKWRLPFTPGLIPKRRDEIADALGKLVIKHLITADGLEKKLSEKGLRDQIAQRIQSAGKRWLDNGEALREKLPAGLDADRLLKRLDRWMTDEWGRVGEKLLKRYGDYPLRDVLPRNWQAAVERECPRFSRYITEGLADFLDGAEGRALIKDAMFQLLERRGLFGNLLNWFLDGDALVEQLVFLLKKPAVAEWLESRLREEWQRTLSLTVGDANARLNVIGLLPRAVSDLPLKDMLATGLARDVAKWSAEVFDRVVPWAVDRLLERAAASAPVILRSLALEDLVAEQVRRFSVQELEEVILFISKKEFKMITYLGFLLGGLIGGVQAFFVLALG
jgi:uncharacterized membrane protein YheB (UPF0754 family)